MNSNLFIHIANIVDLFIVDNDNSISNKNTQQINTK